MLCSLARLVGENGSVIAYANDIHLIGSPATVGLALSSLTQLSTPVEALSLDCRLSSLGLALSLGKTSILLGREANPQALETGLGSDMLTRLDASTCHDGHITCTGHAVLGTPIGSEEFMPTFAKHSVDEAIRIRTLISELLLDRESTGAEETDGIFSPDEHDTVLRYCVGAKVKHLLRTLPPRHSCRSLPPSPHRSPRCPLECNPSTIG